jgi:hypothetical protein
MEQCVTVTDARVLDGYCLELTFSDGKRGVVDLKNRIVGKGKLYQALEDIEFFRKVSVSADLGTVVWPNGLDICPDLLYSLAMGKPLPQSTPFAA